MRTKSFPFAIFFALALPVLAATNPDWVKQSNENSEILLKVLVKYAPESASRLGLEGHDTEVTSLPLDVNARTIADLEVALKQLEARLATEKDAAILQDLQILTNSAKLRI